MILNVPLTFNELKLVKLVQKYDCDDKSFKLVIKYGNDDVCELIVNIEFVDKLFEFAFAPLIFK